MLFAACRWCRRLTALRPHRVRHTPADWLWIFWGLREKPEERKEGETGGKQRYKSVSNGGMADRDPVPLPAEVRAKLAELELELSEGEYLVFHRGARRLSARLCCCCSRAVRWSNRVQKCWAPTATSSSPSVDIVWDACCCSDGSGGSGSVLDAGMWCCGGVAVEWKQPGHDVEGLKCSHYV